MKTKYFKFLFFLFCLRFALACSSDNTKINSTTDEALRPTVPITNGEVQIGTQIWMTRNLNVSRYRNGDPIPQVTDPTQWSNLTTGAWCYYNNNITNGYNYGKLYNWYAVNDQRGLAPTGYHVPSDAEWTVLTTFLGGATIAGGKMKASTSWFSPNTGATNSSGFTAIPGGKRGSFGPFSYIGYYGHWWTSSRDGNTPNIIIRLLNYYDTNVYVLASNSENGYSVRCIKD